MITNDKHDSIQVRFVYIPFDGDDVEYITAYYTKSYDETLKMFLTAKENEVEIALNDYDDKIPSKYLDENYLVFDVRVVTDSETSRTVIEVLVK